MLKEGIVAAKNIPLGHQGGYHIDVELGISSLDLAQLSRFFRSLYLLMCIYHDTYLDLGMCNEQFYI